MPTAPETWAVLLDLLSALAHEYREDFRRAVIDAGLGREPVGMLLHAGDIDPRPLTAASLLACAPYYAEASFTRPMEKLAAGGWLEPAGGGAYRLTAKGRAATDSMYSSARKRLASLSPLPPADLERLAGLLRHLLQACLASPIIADQSCVAASGNAGPFVEASPLAYAGRALEALTNFRCDAHRAAWRPTGLGGPTWETLTWLWEGQGDSAATLHEWSQKQPHPRVLAGADYAACLATLAERGWAAPADGDRYVLTPFGRLLRENAENQTDAYFYGPWPAAITPADQDDLHARALAVVSALRP